MECNKEEAKRAMKIAERKLSENDYNGAKKFATKAQNLYPKLDRLEQVLMTIHVYISASNKNNGGGGGEQDWYGILGVDPLADDETVKNRYKKLALLLHPDKNRCNGAEGAFKLVLDAWCMLSDKAERLAYDHKRKSKEVQQKKRWLEETQPKFAAAFAASEAEMAFTKPTATGNYANSTAEAQMLFKRPRKTGNCANPNLETESPTTRGNLNSTFEAKRIFRSRWQM